MLIRHKAFFKSMISNKVKLTVLLLVFSIVSLNSGCKTFSRMLDKSGKVFTIEIETEEPNRGEIVERAVKITENKINAVGVDGEVAKIPDRDNQILVKIYGSNDWEKIKKFLFTTYQLELKRVISPPSPMPVQTYPTKEAAVQIARNDQEVLPYMEKMDYGSSALSEKFVIVEKQAIVNGEDIRDASVYSRTGEAFDNSIIFNLKPEAATKFGDWTGKNVGNYLAIVLNKKVQSAPSIRSQIFDSAAIDGTFTKELAEEIALSLKSGYLPAAMKIIEEKPFEN